MATLLNSGHAADGLGFNKSSTFATMKNNNMSQKMIRQMQQAQRKLIKTFESGNGLIVIYSKNSKPLIFHNGICTHEAEGICDFIIENVELGTWDIPCKDIKFTPLTDKKKAIN